MAQVIALEKRSDVNRRHMGIDCWPVVRNTLMTLASNKNNDTSKPTKQLKYRTVLWDLPKLLYKKKKVFAVFLTDYKYLSRFNNKYFLKDVSVIRAFLNEENKTSNVFVQNAADSNALANETASIFPITIASVLISRILAFFDKNRLLPYVEFILSQPEMKELLNENTSSEKLLRNIYFVIVAHTFFKFILRPLEAEKCFIVCYYSLIGMAMCAACRALCIESVDLQHGVSGSSMRAYGNWNNRPENGFNTLPATFYCWTEMDYNAINRWSKQTNGKHRAIITGNIWRNYLTSGENKLKGSISDSELRLQQLCNNFDRVIIFSGQHTLLPKFIEGVLESAPNQWFFLIRLHPDLAQNELNRADALYSSISKNVNVVESTNMPVHRLMRLADIHLTEWSGTVYDAYFEGLTSVVFTDFGRDYFSDLSDNGIVKEIDSPEKFISYLENFEPSKNGLTNCRYHSLSASKFKQLIVE